MSTKPEIVQGVFVPQLTDQEGFRVSILWGHHHEDDDRPITYGFNTQAELDAFLYGIEEMDGWSRYEIIENLTEWKADWLETDD